MLVTWRALLGELCSFLPPPLADAGRRLLHFEFDRGYTALHLLVWRWMWALPPCSEARKAAFTLGAAAMWIERWRTESAACEPACPGEAFGCTRDIGQRAEALLRIAAWHRNDAWGEAQARKLGGHVPAIPSWERVYERTAEGAIVIGGCTWTGGDELARGAAHRALALAILSDHQAITAHGRALRIGTAEARDRIIDAFTRTALASLPDGPWVMTSADVTRFLELIIEAPLEKPGRWRRATHKTRGGDWEVRLGQHDLYDVRLVGGEEETYREIEGGYIRREFVFRDEEEARAIEDACARAEARGGR